MTCSCCGVPSATIALLALVQAASAPEAKSPRRRPRSPSSSSAAAAAGENQHADRGENEKGSERLELRPHRSPLRPDLFAADDVFDHVGRDVFDFFFAQRACEGAASRRRRWSPVLRRRPVLWLSASSSGRDRRCRRGRRSRGRPSSFRRRLLCRLRRPGRRRLQPFRRLRPSPSHLGFFASSLAFFGVRLRWLLCRGSSPLRVVPSPSFSVPSSAFHRPVQGEDPEVFAVRRGRQRVAARVDRDLLFAFVFERGHRGVGAGAGLEAPEFFAGFGVEGESSPLFWPMKVRPPAVVTAPE